MPGARVVLDVAHAAPLHPMAQAAWIAAVADGWADPRRLHAEGRMARRLLDAARESVASSLGMRADEIFFPPHHAAALAAGLLGVVAATSPTGRVLASAVEHSAVLHAGRWHAERGGRFETIGVDGAGRLDPAELDAALGTAEVSAVAVQSANGEIGTLQPIDAILDVTRRHGVPLVVDAAAGSGVGAFPVQADVLVASPRSWGSAPGVAVLAKRSAVRWRPHEAGEAEGAGRLPGEAPGEVDVPAAVAAAASLAALQAEGPATALRLRRCIDRVRAAAASIGDVQVFGDPVERLPHVVTFSVLYLPGELLVSALDAEGFAVGSGSACTADTLQPSHVLAAVGGVTHGNVRLVLPRDVTDADVDRFCGVLPGVVSSLRHQLGVDDL